MLLDAQVFNTEHDYNEASPSLFLGTTPGLFDTIHKRHPKIWDHYKNMKSLEWDELEFLKGSNCVVEFNTRPTAIARMMRRTLAWQWEADSVAARTLLPLMAPFITAPELQAAYTQITANEILHAACYSEIVRTSFDNPDEVIQEVLSVQEAMARLTVIGETLGTTLKVGSELNLGMRKREDQETYNAAFMAAVAFQLLERVQFMASFAVTFAIGETNAFMPIVKSVQKICQDEFEVHVALGKDVLANEFKTTYGKTAYEQNRERIIQMVDQVMRLEFEWVDYLHHDGDVLVGLTPKLLKAWIFHCVLDFCRTMKLKADELPFVRELAEKGIHAPKENPLPFMGNWIDISKIQPSPQEEQNGQYKMNVMERTDAGKTYDVDF